MNEQYAAEPLVITSAMVLKGLLEKFGPMTGRYLTAYPSSWRQQVDQMISKVGDIEAVRMKLLLQNAGKKRQIIGGSQLPFDESREWLDNCKVLLESEPIRRLEAVVVGPRYTPERYHDVFDIEEFSVSPTSEERTFAEPNEFLRVSKTLLATSTEIGFVDNYLNPCKPDVAGVLQIMMGFAAKNRCESIRIWARAKIVLESNTEESVRIALENIVPRQTKNKLHVQLNLLDDHWMPDPEHPRYLVTAYGAIRFDRGFVRLRGGGKMDVVPISSEKAFQDIYCRYFQGEGLASNKVPPINIFRTGTSV